LGKIILSGGGITALAPLWMRCTIQTAEVVAAGPLFNFAAAAAIISLGRSSWNGLSYFIWMSCAFNLLVACGQRWQEELKRAGEN
jgi:hypothetical protein